MEILGGIRCVSCGYDKFPALQIDHVNGNGKKEREKFKHRENFMAYYVRSPELARKELQVLCANCHAVKTFENKEYN